MRYTVIPRMHLSRLPLPTRVLLTCFVLAIDVALVVGAQKYADRAEFSPVGATTYFHGAAGSAAPADGELLADEALLDDPAAAPTPRRKSARFLVDVVHPHLFTVPIVLFVLLHLLVLTRVPDRWKIALHLHAFAAFGATFGLPFLVAGSGAGATAFIVAGVNLYASFAAASAIVLWETWRATGAAPPADGP